MCFRKGDNVKENISILLVIALLLLAGACSGVHPGYTQETDIGIETGTDDTPYLVPKQTPKPEQRIVQVGVSIYRFDDGFMTLVRNELEECFEGKSDDLMKYEVTMMDAKNNADEQINHVGAFAMQGVDMIIINLGEPSPAASIVEIAKGADIPVIFLNCEPSEEDMQLWDRISLVGLNPDPRQSGTFQGEIICDLPDSGDINGDGVVSYVMINGAYENMHVQYPEYSIKALTDAGIQVEELLTKGADGGWDDAQKIAAEAIAKFGEKIDVFFCNSDMIAIGAYQAIASAGLTVGDDVYLVGVGAFMEAVDMIGNGQMTGTLSYDPTNLARFAADIAILAANSDSIEKYYYLDYIKVVESTVRDTGRGFFDIVRE